MAAARTRRHYGLEDFFVATLRPCASIIVRKEPHVHKTTAAPLPEGVARRADLALTLLLAKRPTMLVDLKVINEYAKDYASCGARGAAEKKQAKSAKEYERRTRRTDVRVWVFTVGGRLSSHASADLALLARELGMAKEVIVAGAYAAVLKGHVGVLQAYEASVARCPA